MPKILSSPFLTEAGKYANRPVELYQFYLDEQTLYFAAHPTNIHFYNESGNETTYYAWGLSRSAVKTDTSSQIDEVTIYLDNVTLDMSAIIGHTNLVGRRAVVWKVFRMVPVEVEEILIEGTIENDIRISPAYDLSEYGTCEDSSIRWALQDGQSAKVETSISIDGGTTWSDWVEVVSGQTVPGLYYNMDLSLVQFKIRQNPASAISASYFAIGTLGNTNSGVDDYGVIFDGLMDEPVISEYNAKVTVLSDLDFLGSDFPGRIYRRLCTVKFGSTSCGVSLGTVTGTVSSVNIDGVTLTLSGRSEAGNYFEDGILIVGSEYRRVMSSNAGTIVVDYPFVENVVGDSYTLRRGCDKRYDTCSGRFANQANFRGFRSVPNEVRIFR
jgi:hypothetical protein